jgi:hypothetical protein
MPLHCTVTIGDIMENLAKALVKAQGKLHNLGKNAKGYGYEYLTLDKLIDETRGVLAECGLAILQPMAVVDDRPAVKTVLLHESGEMIEGTYPITAVTMKQCNNAQEMGAAVTYARRYGLAAMLNIAQADDDGACIGKSTTKQQDPSQAKAEAMLDKYSGQISEDTKLSAWVDACVADGFYQDLYNGLAQRFGN